MPTDCAYVQRMASGMRAWFLVICPNSLPAPVAIREAYQSSHYFIVCLQS